MIQTFSQTQCPNQFYIVCLPVRTMVALIFCLSKQLNQFLLSSACFKSTKCELFISLKSKGSTSLINIIRLFTNLTWFPGYYIFSGTMSLLYYVFCDLCVLTVERVWVKKLAYCFGSSDTLFIIKDPVTVKKFAFLSF